MNVEKIAFHADGFGDFFVCFKALYALKQLYPKHKLILLHNGVDYEFLRGVGFIDEVIVYENLMENIREIYPDIFITMIRSGKFFRELMKLNLKKCIVSPHFLSIRSSYFTTPLPYFRAKKHMSEVALKLVRAIDSKHYDKNINSIDFSKVKDFLPHSSHLTSGFLASVESKYEKIIGINAFSNNSEYRGFNFFTRDWLNIAQNLSKNYPQFLFVLLNFQSNRIQFNLDESENLRVFVNDSSIASLIDMTKRLDYFITIDTGNLHIADILQIPTLAFISKLAAYRFSGGSYHKWGGVS